MKTLRQPTPKPVYANSRPKVAAVTPLANGKMLAIAYQDGSVRIVDLPRS